MNNTLLFGNGINRLSDKNISWKKLLSSIKDSNDFIDDKSPNTMVYERIIIEKHDSNSDLLSHEYNTKNKIAKLLSDTDTSDIYIELYNLNFQNYITTNYDYAFINSVLKLDEILTPIHEYSSEDVYSIRRRQRISNIKELEKNIWQIHGEIRKPATIMLGLDHYCGSIGKISDYIKGSYRYRENEKNIIESSIEDKILNNTPYTNSSWVELFFNSNIHIIGFDLDYSEIDLWWILNKRSRMIRSSKLMGKIKNKIVYHCTDIDEEKKGIMSSMDIDVNIIKLNNDKNYEFYYKQFIQQLKI
ncbi:hypothetical protein [Aeromonas veronii]|uniref:hypothetical protein n=1 Tax=Aeromonas veronii TaxID=654 RepID=UPI003D24A5F1|nr:SIR2 family protein [Aeromonas veronii]